MRFTADIVKPLLNRVDVVRYTQMSRALKVAEEYAVRLLLDKHSEADAKNIASHLVQNYPEHAFPVGIAEAASMREGYDLANEIAEQASEKQQKIFDRMLLYLDRFTAMGPIEEITDDGE